MSGNQVPAIRISPRRAHRVWGNLICGLAAAWLAGCAALSPLTNVPPVGKVGLIAPFEGLYRARGYAALTALRRGLEDCAPPGAALIPLALDGGADPAQSRRAAAKLNLDPTVRAVVGPLDLASAAAASENLAASNLPWIVPALVSPAGGYPARPDASSMEPLVAALLQAQSPPPARLLIGGLPDLWQPDSLAARGDIPLLLVDTPVALLRTAQAGDAVLWLGLAHEAAAMQDQLGARGLAVPFWLGPASDAAIFAAHMARPAEAYWLIWQDPAYNFDSNAPSPPYIDNMELESLLVYQATCAALTVREITGNQAGGPVWEVRAYRLNADGTFTPVISR